MLDSIGVNSIDAMVGTWDEQTDIWDRRFYNPMQRELLMSKDAAASMLLYQMDATNQDAGNNITSFVERSGLAVTWVDSMGIVIIDASKIKECTRIYPLIEGTVGGVVTVKIGYQMNRYDSVTWEASDSFTIGTDEWVDCRVNGRYLAVRFESNTNIEWSLYGFDMDIEVTGER